MGTFTVTDDDDLHTLTLSGADANEFEIVDNELKLKDEVSVDFETKSSYEVTVIATDSGGLRFIRFPWLAARVVNGYQIF
jgi:hypothetical protein